MDVKQVSKLIEVVRLDVLRMFKQWADSVPEPDKPFIGTASGELFSPRQIVEHIERQTPEGDEFVQDWIRVAINKATLEMLQPQPAAHDIDMAVPVPTVPDLAREHIEMDMMAAELDLENSLQRSDDEGLLDSL